MYSVALSYISISTHCKSADNELGASPEVATSPKAPGARPADAQPDVSARTRRTEVGQG